MEPRRNPPKLHRRQWQPGDTVDRYHRDDLRDSTDCNPNAHADRATDVDSYSNTDGRRTDLDANVREQEVGEHLAVGYVVEANGAAGKTVEFSFALGTGRSEDRSLITILVVLGVDQAEINIPTQHLFQGKYLRPATWYMEPLLAHVVQA